MKAKHLSVMIHIGIKGEVGTVMIHIGIKGEVGAVGHV